MCILLIVAFLFGFHRFQGATRSGKLAWAAQLVVTVALLYRLRFYFVLVLVVAAVVVCAAKAVIRLGRGPRAEALAHVLLIAALTLTLALSASLNREWFGKPHNAAAVARRLAAYMLSIGEGEGAVWQLGSAVTISTGALPGTREYDVGIQAEMGKLLNLSTAAAPGAPEYELAIKEALAKLTAGGGRIQVSPRQPPSQKPFVSLEEAEFMANSISRLSTLDSMRRSFIRYGGASNIDKDVRYDGVVAVIRYLPKAMFNATLTPNPFTRFDAVGPTGSLRTLSTVEVALIAVLLVLAGRGILRGWLVAPELVACLALFSILLITLLGLVVPTVGLLFRFRLGFVIPLCILAGGPARWPWARRR
ncbi:MAG: hypothetical protein HY217_08475 [Candidatus Rokubacteria bacterium]|nr:hypothetical protein [Candidatus Rokubacteria bacterium]